MGSLLVVQRRKRGNGKLVSCARKGARIGEGRGK